MKTLRDIKNLKKERQKLRYEMEEACLIAQAPFIKKINQLSIKIDGMVTMRKTERARNKITANKA